MNWINLTKYSHFSRVCELESKPLWILKQTKGLLGLLFILGGTWIIGVINTIINSFILTYIFTALNSLQGLFIFMFNVVLTDGFRQLLRKFCAWFNEEAGVPGGGNLSTTTCGK